MEMEKVPQAGYKIEGIDIAGIDRGNLLSNLGLPFKILKSLSKSKKIIKNFAPDFAVGTGGFASGPALYEASKMGIPIFIQEQNAHAGVTNKILSKKAKAVFTAYPKVEGFPAEKIKFLGNPIREILFQECRKPLRQKKKWA
jgi:UDP-N-acetylglucosamine--N-acetylmuramyl-(pentapeptide) pyrophosphoryl-undecaprenol N-acetylglucosamine transferase